MRTSLVRSLIGIVLTLICLAPALADRPPFDPLLQKAEQALKDNNLDQAIILYEKLANFYPESSLAQNRLGYAHYLKGNDPRAIYSFRKALSLSRNNEEALHNLLLASGRQADHLARANAFKEAAGELDDLIAAYSWHPQHAVLLYYRGRMEFLRGQPDDGLAWWKKAAAQAPQSGVAKVVAAQSRPLTPDTVALYREAADKVKTEPAFDYLLGKRYLDQKQYQAAYDEFEKGIEKSRAADIPFPLLSLNLAEMALDTGHADEAVKVLEEAKVQRPDWASLRTLLWPAYLAVNNPTAADQALQESYELDRRPKLAVLGTPDFPVRLTTANGSLRLIPPTAVSVNPGEMTLTNAKGQSQKFTVGEDQAIVYKSDDSGLSQQSTATLVSNAGGAGQLAPPLVAKDRRGRIYRLAESLLKRPVVLLFWDVSDSDANTELISLGAVASHFGDDVETVAIHCDPKNQKDAQRLYLSLPSTSAQLWGDADTSAMFGLDKVPALIVVDKNGRIALVRDGDSAQMFDGLIDYLETLPK